MCGNRNEWILILWRSDTDRAVSDDIPVYGLEVADTVIIHTLQMLERIYTRDESAVADSAS